MNEQNTQRLPLWKNILEEIRATGFSYGTSWKADFFEERLKTTRNTPQFSFEMLALKQTIEEEDGYYLRSSENGAIWEIPHAYGHEETARGFDHKLRRFAVRSINLRSATLMNPKADLTACERARMEKNLERASLRLVLLSRQQSISNAIKKHAPKLLAATT